MFCQFDMIAKFLTTDIEVNEVSTQLKSELTNLANCYIYKYTPNKSSLKKQKMLQKLRSQKGIIITHPDKGNGIVILNRSDYIKSMTELISDNKKLKKLTSGVTIKREQALQRTLRKLNKKSIFIESEYFDLYPKGSKIARLYGTPRIHKPFSSGSVLPLRPIVSFIDTYNDKLTQYLGSLLSPNIPSNYTTKSSFTFIEEIKQLNTYAKFLMSFDITSLITNIPLEETINIAIETIFENHRNVKFTRKELQKLFKIGTSETHFIFNNEIYDQRDGVSVGSPLAPILANLFMGYHEKDSFNTKGSSCETYML